MLAALLATKGVVETVRLASRIGVMALHGGLETGTEDAAASVAESVGASLYAVTQPEDLAWHVPSTKYLPAASTGLSGFLDHVRVTVSFHGFGRPGLENTVLLGGRNRQLASAIGDAIAATGSVRVVADVAEIPEGLRGLHPANPVNLPPEAGVQLELSAGARRVDHIAAIVAAVSRVLCHHGTELPDQGGNGGPRRRGSRAPRSP